MPGLSIYHHTCKHEKRFRKQRSFAYFSFFAKTCSDRRKTIKQKKKNNTPIFLKERTFSYKISYLAFYKQD